MANSIKKATSPDFKDLLLHEITGKSLKKDSERPIFPITRYDNILNKPIVTETMNNMSNPEFMLFVESYEEVPDEEIFELFGTNW